MIHVAPLLRSRFRLPARGRAPGPHRFVCLPQAKRGGQIDPDHERPSFRRREPGGVHHARAVRAQGVVRAQDRYERRAVADIAYRVRFSSSADGPQTATVRRVEGAQAAETGDSGQVMIEAAPVSTGRDARVTEAGRYRFFAGWRSDPFFFDTRGALNDLQFTGDDFFIDKDVCSIVLEMPNSALGSKRVGLWARTLDGAGGVWVQADRGALPAQAVFLVGSERDGYHAGEPANDARFITVFAHALEHTGGYAPEEARRGAGTLLPDMLSYDPPRPAAFPGNGRTATDDAADAFLAGLTNWHVTGDKVGPHIDLLAEFPYLGPP